MKLDRPIPVLPMGSMPASIDFYQKLGFRVEQQNEHRRDLPLSGRESLGDQAGQLNYEVTFADSILPVSDSPPNLHPLLRGRHTRRARRTASHRVRPEISEPLRNIGGNALDRPSVMRYRATILV